MEFTVAERRGARSVAEQAMVEAEREGYGREERTELKYIEREECSESQAKTK